MKAEPSPTRGPIAWMTRNHVTANLLMITFILGGIISYVTLPREGSPDVTIPFIYVAAVYEGVAPSEIEHLVTIPLEKQFNNGRCQLRGNITNRIECGKPKRLRVLSVYTPTKHSFGIALLPEPYICYREVKRSIHQGGRTEIHNCRLVLAQFGICPPSPKVSR